MPVTQNQVELKDNSQIVSKTDLKAGLPLSTESLLMLAALVKLN